MINDFISNIILALDNLLNEMGLYDKMDILLSYLDDYSSYTTEFNKYLSGVYFVVGKPLVIYLLSVAVTIIIIRFIFAIVNLVGQYVP